MTEAKVGCALILLAGAIAVGVSCLLGVAASWVLSYFTVVVPWYVCSVGIFLLGAIFRPAQVSM